MNFPTDTGKIWFNGELIKWTDATTHVINQGLHYAASVFEGERAYAGVVFKEKEHHDRLIRSAQLLDFTVPYSADEITAAVRETVKANNMDYAYVRPVAWVGGDKMGISSVGNSVNVAIACWEMKMFSEDLIQEGITMHTSKWRKPSPETAPCESKAAGLYMIGMMSKNEAERAGYNDALMLDYRGYVAEATGANLFMVKNGELFTPTPDCFLNGLTRQTVIGLAETLGINITVRHIMPEELKEADEVFITGTAAEVMPVKSIDEKIYGVGPISMKIRNAYMELVHAHQKSNVA